jgi:hypothetical protein
VLFFLSTRGYELRRVDQPKGCDVKHLKDDYKELMEKNEAHFFGSMPAFDDDSIATFDDDIKSLREWKYEEDGKEEKMEPELLKMVSDWVYDLAGAYLTKYHVQMPVPEPLPCGPREINLEWFREDTRFLAGIILSEKGGFEITDYYGKDKRDGKEIHGLFPPSKEKNDEIITFLHDHVDRI